MAKARIGGGKVEIELEGKPLTLEPRLEACIAISSMAGGLRAAAERCANLHFETVLYVISAGLNLNPTQRDKMLPKAIYEAGIVRASGWAIDFINIVGNGGRPLAEDDGEEAGEGAEAPLGSQS